MSWRRLTAPLLAGLAALAIWLGYAELGLLRGTLFWEFRLILLGLGSFLLLSVTEWGTAQLLRRLGPRS